MQTAASCFAGGSAREAVRELQTCLVGMEAFGTTHSQFQPEAARAVRAVISLYDTAFCAALSTRDVAFL